MITYVNTVLVNNATTATLLSGWSDVTDANKGRFIVYDVDAGAYISAVSGITDAVQRIKVGLVLGAGKVKWSNIINRHDVKSFVYTAHVTDTEDKVTIDFTNLNAALLTEFAKGGKRIVVRLTFKDLPTRYRKWTESYEYITKVGDTKATIATGIADLINGEAKRARVTADKSVANKVILDAMLYDDDNAVETLNWADKVRFNANVYYTDPAAEGWESLNKHFPTGVAITKVPGTASQNSWKIVRDREAQAMGYEGILNRGMGTWPIIKPDMLTDKTKSYNSLVLEFVNMYRAADDIFRKTKQTLEIYGVGLGTKESTSGQTVTAGTGILGLLEKFVA